MAFGLWHTHRIYVCLNIHVWVRMDMHVSNTMYMSACDRTCVCVQMPLHACISVAEEKQMKEMGIYNLKERTWCKDVAEVIISSAEVIEFSPPFIRDHSFGESIPVQVFQYLLRHRSGACHVCPVLETFFCCRDH